MFHEALCMCLCFSYGGNPSQGVEVTRNLSREGLEGTEAHVYDLSLDACMTTLP